MSATYNKFLILVVPDCAWCRTVQWGWSPKNGGDVNFQVEEVEKTRARDFE